MVRNIVAKVSSRYPDDPDAPHLPGFAIFYYQLNINYVDHNGW